MFRSADVNNKSFEEQAIKFTKAYTMAQLDDLIFKKELTLRNLENSINNANNGKIINIIIDIMNKFNISIEDLEKEI